MRPISEQFDITKFLLTTQSTWKIYVTRYNLFAKFVHISLCLNFATFILMKASENCTGKDKYKCGLGISSVGEIIFLNKLYSLQLIFRYFR